MTGKCRENYNIFIDLWRITTVNKVNPIAALAVTASLLSAWGTASAAPYSLFGWFQRSTGGSLSSLLFKAGAAQGCPGPGYQQPCYNPNNAFVLPTTIIADVSAGAPAFDWDGTTLTGTGLFWATSYINSNPNSTAVISDKVTTLSIVPGTSTTTVATYECVEGLFLAGVGAVGCKNINKGANAADNTATVWQVGGNPYCVSQTIAGDDYSLTDGGLSGTLSYNLQTANFSVGRDITGATSTATANVLADADLGATGTLTLSDVENLPVPGTGFNIGETITDVLGGSAKVAAQSALAFVQGTSIPRGPRTEIAGAQGASCKETSGAFDNYKVLKDDGQVLILSDVGTPGNVNASVGNCILFGIAPLNACPVNPVVSSVSYMVFVAPGAVDTDADGVPNSIDNCTLVANANQLDTNGDGYGNICDADINNSGTVTTADFGLLRSVLGQAWSRVSNGPPPNTTISASDMNGSGTVTTADFGLLRARLGTAPGPSGLH